MDILVYILRHRKSFYRPRCWDTNSDQMFQYGYYALMWLRFIPTDLNTYQTIWLLWSSTTACTKEMTALSWFGPEASSLMTLWTTINLTELLAVMWAFAPTTFCARFVARSTIPFRLMKLIIEAVLGCRASNYFVFPFNSFDVTQIIIVEYANTTCQYVWKY